MSRRRERYRSEVAGTSRWLMIVYLISSCFSALVFSVLAVRSRRKGGTGVLWITLALLAAAFFGTVSYSLVITSSPAHDAGWYYLGLSTLVANGLAILNVFRAVRIKA